MSRVQHVVWDWNGTLLDDADLCVSIMNQMLLRRSLPPITQAFYRSVIEFPVEGYYRKLGFDFSLEPFESLSDEFVALYQAGWQGCGLQAGALEALAALREAGVGQSVLSASKAGHLREQLDRFGVTPLIDFATGAENHHGRGKADLAREHVASTGVDPSRVIFVGDTEHDAATAMCAGCACLLVSFGHYAPERLQPFGMPAGSMEAVASRILRI